MNKVGRIFHILTISVFLIAVGCKKENKVEQPLVLRTILGTVTNPFSQPLAGAKVLLTANTPMATYTDKNGHFYYTRLSYPDYTLTISMTNYITQSKSITLVSDTTRIEVFLQPGTPKTVLSDSILLFSYKGGVKPITITSNSSWTVNNTTDWISCNLTSGNGNGAFVITCQENPNMATRSCTIKVNDGANDHPILVQQGYQVLLTGTSYTPGNGITGEQDSVTLSFNQPVKVNDLTSVAVNCFNEMDKRYLGDSSSIRFNFNCGRLGGEFQFVYTVQDKLTNATTGTAKVRFYNNLITFPGKISSCYIMDDNNTIWVALQWPGRLLEVSLTSHTVIRTINLPYNPSRICMSPWDHKLYLIANDPAHNRYDSTIYVINPVNGSTERTIPIRRDQYDHPQSPTIFPYALEFTKTGYGAVLLRADGSTAYRWKVIDCAHGDSVSIHPTWFTNPDYHDFANLYVPFGKEKIMMTSHEGFCDIAVLDGNKHNIDLLVPPVVSYGNFLRPNRLNGKLFLAQAYEQYILHPDNTYSLMSHIDLEDLPGADYTYRNNEPEVMYVCADNLLSLVDYSTGNTIMTTELQYGLVGLMSTTNGTQVVMIRSSDNNSDLLFFESSIFDPKR